MWVNVSSDEEDVVNIKPSKLLSNDKVKFDSEAYIKVLQCTSDDNIKKKSINDSDSDSGKETKPKRRRCTPSLLKVKMDLGMNEDDLVKKTHSDIYRWKSIYRSINPADFVDKQGEVEDKVEALADLDNRCRRPVNQKQTKRKFLLQNLDTENEQTVDVTDDVLELSGRERIEIRDKSPTPPPTPKDEPTKKKCKRKKGVKHAIRALVKVKSGACEESKDSDSNDLLIDDDTDSKVSDDIVVRVIVGAHVQRFPMNMHDCFSKLSQLVARVERVSPEKVFFLFGDKTIHFQDTPASVGLTKTDFLECHILNAETSQSVATSNDGDPDVIRLRVQSDQNKSRVTIAIHRLAPLRQLMTQFCSMKAISFDSVAFHFDGDAIAPTDTADSLSLDNDDCIDVIHLDGDVIASNFTANSLLLNEERNEDDCTDGVIHL